MPRIARFIRNDRQTVYHVISRTALAGLTIKDTDKDYLLGLINRLSRLYFVDVLGFAVMGNHFHLVARMHPEDEISNSDIIKRWQEYYGDKVEMPTDRMVEVKKRLCSLGAYVKDIKQNFTRYYNKKHRRQGFFWGGRFKSMIVQEGSTLVNLLAYVDLNPIRAGIVKKPEDYRWSSLGYHTQAGNKDSFLSIDFGLKEWNELDPKEIVRKYRQFVYETGAVDAGKGKTIDQKVVEKARKKGYKISRVERFRYRCRYFTDSGVIGGKD
ncbi:transposase, partial [Desulfonatronospira sp.]|uniref:transposase n=1 Tax=Desulfonatronospira sp. TaxID=1962951 RepID=UPI0025BFD1D9